MVKYVRVRIVDGYLIVMIARFVLNVGQCVKKRMGKNNNEVKMENRKKLKQEYIDILEALEWKVCGYTDDGRVEIETYSPGGEDFVICVSIEDFPKEVFAYAEYFDIDEHIVMWLEAKRNGTNGVPSTRELVHDAEEIEKMLQQLSDALNNPTKPNKISALNQK